MEKKQTQPAKKKSFLLYLTPRNYYLMKMASMKSDESISGAIDRLIDEYAASHPKEVELAESLMALSKDAD